jgi:hypothetical protein
MRPAHTAPSEAASTATTVNIAPADSSAAGAVTDTTTGITYAQLARELCLAESSVKRLFSKGDLSLARIDQVLAVLKLDFAELARSVAASAPARRELALAQEQAVVADPKLLLVTICALGEWSLEQIVATYRLTRALAAAALETLHPLDLIELRAQHRYRLKLDKTFSWRPHGPAPAEAASYTTGAVLDVTGGR